MSFVVRTPQCSSCGGISTFSAEESDCYAKVRPDYRRWSWRGQTRGARPGFAPGFTSPVE